MFEFHRLGWTNGDHEEVSGWLCLIDTHEKLLAVLEHKTYEIAADWMDIKDSPEDKEGHTRTRQEGAYKQLLIMHMEKLGKSKMSMVECISFIENMATKTIIQIFNTDGEVYWNAAGGCRDTHLRDDHRGVDEEIFEKCQNKDLVFPCMSTNEVKIKRWPYGQHFYISLNGITVAIDGVQKYNTIGAAEDAKKKFLKNNRFKKNFCKS